MTEKRPIPTKLETAKNSLTVWFSAAVPILLAAAITLQDQLPLLGSLLSGWNLFFASVAVSGMVAALRVRSAGATPAAPTAEGSPNA
jgi:hypothetical protein